MLTGDRVSTSLKFAEMQAHPCLFPPAPPPLFFPTSTLPFCLLERCFDNKPLLSCPLFLGLDIIYSLFDCGVVAAARRTTFPPPLPFFFSSSSPLPSPFREEKGGCGWRRGPFSSFNGHGLNKRLVARSVALLGGAPRHNLYFFVDYP